MPDWLQQFLTLPEGIPSAETFQRVFERINPKGRCMCQTCIQGRQIT
ncbi:hypothetical protein RintRC_6946 [Richelia intracellularis]|nr:hypothetical protein RintRC_6946 [Richelia intracellularis]